MSRAGVLDENYKKKHGVVITDWAVDASTYKYSLFLISLVNKTEWSQCGAHKQNEVTSPCYEFLLPPKTDECFTSCAFERDDGVFVKYRGR